MMRRLLPLLVLSVAAACNAGDTTTSLSEGVTTSEGATSTTGSIASTTTSTAATTTQPPPQGADCVVGSWLLDNDAFVENLGEIFGEEGGEVRPLDGTYSVEIAAGGEMSASRVDWGFEVTTAEGTITLRINGDETGSWSADDSTLTVSLTGEGVTFEATIEADGEVLEVDPSLFPVPETIASDTAYTCEGDVLNITSDGVTSTFDRQ